MFQSAIKGAVADTQFLCGAFPVAVITLQGFFEHLLTQVVQVQVLLFFLGFHILLCHSVLGSRYWSVERRERGRRDRRQLCGRDRGADGCCTALHIVELLLQSTHLTTHIVHITTQFEEDLIEDLAFVLKTMVATLTRDRSQLSGLVILGDKLPQEVGSDQSLRREHADLLGDVLQLTHVARPLVFQQQLLGTLIEGDAVHLVFLRHLHGKETEQQHDVLAAFTQRWHLDGNGVQTVIEVFAEASLADSLTDVHIRGSHDTYIGLADLGAADGDIFSRFEHTEQSGLCSHRQLSHLIEEQGALVGHAEVARGVVDGTCIGALHMSEEFGVDGAFGD